uniref:PHD-type domain-containing protein n=1 Tax=Anopheles atroparvus TaxID=41427 RepID=A0A182IQS3_ANOAO
MADVCRSCSLPAGGTNTYVCGGSCKAVYHSQTGCLGVPGPVIKELKRSDTHLSWKCASCLASPSNDVENLRHSLTSLVESVKSDILALERRLTAAIAKTHTKIPSTQLIDAPAATANTSTKVTKDTDTTHTKTTVSTITPVKLVDRPVVTHTWSSNGTYPIMYPPTSIVFADNTDDKSTRTPRITNTSDIETTCPITHYLEPSGNNCMTAVAPAGRHSDQYIK